MSVCVCVCECVEHAGLLVLFMRSAGLEECECLLKRLTSLGKRGRQTGLHTHTHTHTHILFSTVPRAHTHTHTHTHKHTNTLVHALPDKLIQSALRLSAGKEVPLL